MPLPAAGLGPGGIRTVYRMGLISAARALTLVLIAQAIATGVVGVIEGTTAWQPAIVMGLVASAARAMLTWAARVASARAALGAKEALRALLAERLLGGGQVPVGSSTVLASRGLDELDDYYGTVLPAVMNVAIIPLVVGARILFADWVSALIIVLTVPLVPVFMALVGLHTREHVAHASGALARLSDHLVELARGLPVLVGLGRVEEQTAALERVSDDYRRTTMLTLRTAFLSSLVLELISTISVAVVAVFVGIRLVDGDLPLAVGLLVLVLAPECFAPFRELGAAFHASQNGLAALRSTRAILDAPVPPAVTSAGGGLVLERLGIRYPGHASPVVDGLTAVVPRRGVTALVGESGSGKSSVLAVLAGRLANGTDGAVVTGRVLGVDAGRIAWLPQHPVTVADTVEAELRLYSHGLPTELRDARISELAALLGFRHLLLRSPVELSPGELRRVAFARALLRVDCGADLLLLDEPTAHLDDASASAVRREIARLRGRVTVVLASHDPATNALAGSIIRLREPMVNGGGAVLQGASLGGFSHASVDDHGLRPQPDPVVVARPEDSASTYATVGMLWRFVGAARRRFAGATVLATSASLFAVSLTAVSGWLIVRASEHPAIMYLLVAIVGVRFFGIGRSVLAYASQLASHDAIFRSTGSLRMRLWRAIARRGAATRTLLRGGTTVDYLVITADRIRDLAPRVVLPIVVGVLVSLAAVIGVALLHPAAVPLLIGCVLISTVVAPVVALRADRSAGVERAALGSLVARRFAALVGAAADLHANGVDATARAELAELDREAGRRGKRAARALGLGQAVVVFACCATALLMLPLSLTAVAAGTLPGEVIAVLVLLPLALLEPLSGLVAAAQQWPTLAAALRSADRITGRSTDESAGTAGIARVARIPSVRALRLDGVSARWPDAPAPAFSGLAASAGRGHWLVVQGPSGSGKSTLLTMLLGYLAPSGGRYLLDETDASTVWPAELRRHLAWSPQDAHLFDSTIRSNLLLARPRNDAPSDQELRDVLRRVGLDRLIDDLPAGLDSPVGSQGSLLSGGERQRLSVARSLLTRADILLLDEPTAHLDAQAAVALMADLRRATSDQLVVLVTHHADDLAATDLVLDLAAAPDLADLAAAPADTPGRSRGFVNAA